MARGWYGRGMIDGWERDVGTGHGPFGGCQGRSVYNEMVRSHIPFSSLYHPLAIPSLSYRITSTQPLNLRPSVYVAR